MSSEKTHWGSNILWISFFFKITVAGQDSPFWTLDAGGCMKSLKGTNASFSAEQTSAEEQVMHSTKVGYKAITWAHVLPSTVIKKYKISKTCGFK